MRILFCTLDYAPSDAGGGAERQAQLQAEGLVRRGHQVDIVCPRIGGLRSGTVSGIRVYRLPRLSRWPLRPISYLLLLGCFLILRLRRYDLVHVHLANLQADVAVAVAMLLGRPSYLKVAAGGPLGEIGRFRRVAVLTRYFGIRHATLVQAISEEIEHDVAAVDVQPDRIVRIPNGVVIPTHGVKEPDRRAARRTLNLPADEVIALYAGRLERYKGVEDLISVWRDRPAPSARLLLVGSAGQKDPARINDLPPNVEDRPWASDTGSYLAAADLFILPSHAEGMSNALLEAMATGLPCVATRVGAAEEMIQDGESGLLIDPGDLPAMRAAIQRLAVDPALRARIGGAGRSSVADRFGIDSVVIQIEDAYRLAGSQQ
jgi:glycosyltransferase involved in cell wall biosynthesis